MFNIGNIKGGRSGNPRGIIELKAWICECGCDNPRYRKQCASCGSRREG